MATWDDLDQELELWQDAGDTVTLWWRDDDAVEPTEALDRLIVLSFDNSVPCALAVVPDMTTGDLVEVLNEVPTIFPVQHGFRHINHAPKGEKAAEFGLHRELEEIENDLKVGSSKMAPFVSCLPIFVPPWNRMSDTLNDGLAELGFEGVSQHAPRKAKRARGGLCQVNTHVDIINWRTTRGFVGEEKALSFLLSHLRDRRTKAVDQDEPTGILTHHLDHDEECWGFMERLMRWTSGKSNVRWLAPFEAFQTEAPNYELEL